MPYGFEERNSHRKPEGTEQHLRMQLVVYLLGNSWSVLGQMERRQPRGEEGESITGLEAGKLIGEDASQMWLLDASLRNPSHGLLTSPR